MPESSESTIWGTTANKGEWAELYVFLMLLGEGKLYAADEDLRRRSDSYLEVLKILRGEISEMIVEYVRTEDEEKGAVVEIVSRGETFARIGADEFLTNAIDFFEYLSSSKTPGKGSVKAPDDIYRFCDMIKITKPKSPSISTEGTFGGKTDIVINLRDARNALVSTMGFSIKSQFASAPTLYNAGSSTQFLYEIEGIDDAGMERFNALADDGDWTAASKLYAESGWQARFIRTCNEITNLNLFYIRDSMTDLIAWIYRFALLERYPEGKDLEVICKTLAEENPLNYPNTDLYEKCIKDFLFATFAGMTGGKRWDGVEQVNGGYIVVKPDGEVLCYHANDRENFRDYLLNRTHIEYVSRKKYKWGRIEKDDEGKYTITLNASVRFKSIPKNVL